MILKKFIGDKAFYKKALAVTLPILVQQIITNFLSLVDNLMVGRVGTEEMTGVAIVNQLLFVFNLCIFGAISGAGIFSAQYYGKGDNEGVRDTFRIKLILVFSIAFLAEVVLFFFGEPLINMFLHEGNEPIDLEKTFMCAKQYLSIAMLGLPAFSLMQAYSDTLRSTDKTVLPMNTSLMAVSLNIVLNYILIYGSFGAPRLGVVGAAIATVTARFVECIILIIVTTVKKEKYPFIKGAYKSLKITKKGLWLQIFKKGLPLMSNEVVWALGITFTAQAYSTRGIEVVSAQNISSTVTNLFNCAFFAFGSAISIIVGQHLGAGNLEKAKEDDNRLIACAMLACTIVGSIMAIFAFDFPELYKTQPIVKQIAGQMLLTSAAFMPLHAFAHAAYFTLRSGGKTTITFIFDSGFMWVITIPVAFVLSRFTNLPILPFYICIQALDVIKVIIGYFMLKSGVWLNNLVEEKNASGELISD